MSQPFAWGIRLAFARNTPARRRLALATFAFGCLSFLVFAIGGSTKLILLRADRALYRTPIAATKSTPTDLLARDTADMWAGKQYTVFAIAAAEPGNETPVLPVGLSTLPEPGQSVLSTALTRLVRANPELAERYPNAVAEPIGRRGTVDDNELLAFVRPYDDSDLRNSPSAVRIQRFGAPVDGERTTRFFSPLGPVVGYAEMGMAAAGFVIGPALLLLLICARLDARARDERIIALRLIGVPWRKLRLVIAGEILGPALLGSLVGALAYAIALRSLGSLPVVGYRLNRVDLFPSFGQAVLLVVAVGVLAAVTAQFATRGIDRALQQSPQPTVTTIRISPVRLVPLGLAVGLYAAAALRGGDPGASLFALATLVTVGAIPFVIGPFVAFAGRTVAELRWLPAQLAGRRLESDPLAAGRLAGAAMLVIFTLVSSEVWLNRFEPSVPTNIDPNAVVIVQVGARSTPQQKLRVSELAGATAAVSVETHERPTANCNPGVVGGLAASKRCRERDAIGRQTGLLDCTSSGDPSAALAQACSILRRSPGPVSLRVLFPGVVDPARAVERDLPVFRDTSDTNGLTSTLYLGAGGRQFEQRVFGAAFATLTAPFVTGFSTGVKLENPLVGWLRLGFATAAAICGLVILIGLIDLARRRENELGVFQTLGCPQRRLREISFLELVIPAFTAVAIATTLSIVTTVAYRSLDGEIGITTGYIIRMATTALAVVVVVSVIACGRVGKRCETFPGFEE